MSAEVEIVYVNGVEAWRRGRQYTIKKKFDEQNWSCSQGSVVMEKRYYFQTLLFSKVWKHYFSPT